MKVAACGFARATWPNSARTRPSVKSDRARSSAYCDSVSRPCSSARESASCLAGVSGGSGRGAAEAGAAPTTRRWRAERKCKLGERMADGERRTPRRRLQTLLAGLSASSPAPSLDSVDVSTVEQHVAEETIQVLDHGFVRLDDSMASDLSVVNAARVSFARRKEVMEEGDAGLIRFLMRERHGTPFEHNAFRFHIRAPIFVAREWFRHRIGSFNEFSMRYAKATDEFYVSAPEDVRSQVGKPGLLFEPVTDEIAQTTREELAAGLRCRLCGLRAARREGRRPRARPAVMPVGAYTEFYWTVNARGPL